MHSLIEENPLKIENFPILDLSALTASSFSAELPAGEKFLSFSLRGKLYAISAGQILEVAQPLPITPMPKVPDWILGIANLRGDIISIVDLTKLWNMSDAPLASKMKLIRLRSSDNSIAFVADKVNEVVTLPGVDIQPVENAAHLFGKISYQSEILHLIDVDKILFLMHLDSEM